MVCWKLRHETPTETSPIAGISCPCLQDSLETMQITFISIKLIATKKTFVISPFILWHANLFNVHKALVETGLTTHLSAIFAYSFWPHMLAHDLAPISIQQHQPLHPLPTLFLSFVLPRTRRSREKWKKTQEGVGEQEGTFIDKLFYILSKQLFYWHRQISYI